MKRRAFIAGLTSVAAWPHAARAQSAMTPRRIGILMPSVENDSENTSRLATFHDALGKLGWTQGRNLHVDYRWNGDTAERAQELAGELLNPAPDVIMVLGNPGTVALRRATRSVPIVFASVGDPVGGGLVESMSRPGGNLTGFTSFEPSMGGKWLEILKKFAPAVTRVSAILNSETAIHVALLHSAESAAPGLGVTLTAANVRDTAEIEHAIDAFAAGPNGGLIVMPHPITAASRDIIIRLAAQHGLPTVYPFRFYAQVGGLISYGASQVDMLRSAASYVDRILRGAKPGDLPVQGPTKFDLVLNQKTARALGLALPPTLLAIVDEVIE